MENIIVSVKNYLEETYHPVVAFLYGSFATETVTDTSDIDCICFAERKAFFHDSSTVDGYILDCWVYPLNRLNEIELLLHILPCRVLIDKTGIAEDIIKSIMKRRAELTISLGVGEKAQLIGWIKKMLGRSAGDSAEALYRYNWLVHDLPELYCKFNTEYYDGPMKTIRRLKDKKEFFDNYMLVLKEKNVEILTQLYSEITGADFK